MHQRGDAAVRRLRCGLTPIKLVFHYDRGLKLTKADLAIDFRRRQRTGFISHAHMDHMARHELALCTPATGRLYRRRFGTRPVRDLPYRQPLEWGGLRLTTYPAGHCLGSAMLLAEDDGVRLLYTGDFKLGESATAERAELPTADILVIESTFGDPRYCHQPRDEAIAELLALVRRTLDDGATPVVEAYELGKSQEVSRILTLAGIGVLQSPSVFAITEVYRQCGVERGDCRPYRDRPQPGMAVVVPPRAQRQGRLRGLSRAVSIAVTGWASNPTTRGRLGVDHAVCLSDHADYRELLSAVERVQPRVVYCTHGPKSFVERLRKVGWRAFPLEDAKDPLAALAACQQSLF